jgi:D-alanyl-D-alanine carboxypeptidase/D-alanyl-D-alanine-endopeptidase (penicillin-binding protein 4)
MTFRTLALAAVCAPLLTSCAPHPPAKIAPAPNPAVWNSRADARAAIDSMVNDPQFRNAHWGMLIVDPTSGDTLYSHNAGKLFMPASNQKILTGSTALVQLGPDFRFTTRFATNGDVRNGVLNGDLVVIGRGDPSFSDAMRGDYRLAFDAMADSLNALGIHHVGGGLRRAGNAFPDDQYGFGWEFDDADEPYGAGIDELYVNEGFTKAKRRNAKGDSVLTDVAIRDHPTVFLNTLHDAMLRKNVTGAGFIDTTLLADEKLTTLFTLKSPPLSEILKALEKPSQNQIAEIFFKTLGLEKTGVGIADSGRVVVERQLAAWGAEKDGFAVRDGSGLSRHDYVSPETIVRVLTIMRTRPEFPFLYDALPIAGVDGTIASRMKNTAAQGNVHAKTGTVDKARSLSGYVTTADGKTLVFSFLCNNFTVSNRAVERVQDVILAHLAASPSFTQTPR